MIKPHSSHSIGLTEGRLCRRMTRGTLGLTGSICQSLVDGCRDPVMIGCPRCDIIADDLSKVAMYPASQS